MYLKTNYQNWKKKRAYKKHIRRMGNPNVRRSELLYPVVVYGSILGLIYGISCIWTNYPLWPSFTSFYIVVALTVFSFAKKNWRMTWLFLRDMKQGRLLLVFNDHTQWSYEHKMKAVKWVYPRRRTIRKERLLELGEKVRTGKALSDSEKREVNYRVLTCPQQVLDGFNKAMLVNNLIWAHHNIQVLDDELREILDLSDENIQKWDFNAEILKCKGEEHQKEVERLKEIGKKNAKKSKQ